MNRTCTKCKESKDISLFYEGRLFCKLCTSAQNKKWREANKEKKAKADKKWVKNNPERAKAIKKKWRQENYIHLNSKKDPIKAFARYTLNNAVRIGIIEKPSECEVCGKSKLLEGHHSDYTKPLDIDWLCTSCHNKTHEEISC